MSLAARSLRAVTASDGTPRPSWGHRLALSAVIDSVAAALVLLDVPVSPAVAFAAAAVLHAIAVLAIHATPRVDPSRRCLGAAAVLAVPCAGAVVAAVALGTRGLGTASRDRARRVARPRASTPVAARRLGAELSACDALERGDEVKRLAALNALARRADSESKAVLRWATSGRDPELAMSAALVLDRIGERAERPAVDRDRSLEVRRARR